MRSLWRWWPASSSNIFRLEPGPVTDRGRQGDSPGTLRNARANWRYRHFNAISQPIWQPIDPTVKRYIIIKGCHAKCSRNGRAESEPRQANEERVGWSNLGRASTSSSYSGSLSSAASLAWLWLSMSTSTMPTLCHIKYKQKRGGRTKQRQKRERKRVSRRRKGQRQLLQTASICLWCNETGLRRRLIEKGQSGWLNCYAYIPCNIRQLRNWYTYIQ